MKHKGNFRRSGFSSFVQSINSIENFSSEILYEIFTYLDGFDISRSFTKLNQRFESLVNNKSFLMNIKIKSTSIFDDHYGEFLQFHSYHIRSLHIFNVEIVNKLVCSSIINRRFNRLESIKINPISIHRLIVLLFNLQFLPCLSSLTIEIDYFDGTIGDIYQMIYRLLNLKYLKIGIECHEDLYLDIHPMINERFSSIEYLVISHGFCLDQVYDLLSYTPRLSHLYCSNIIKSRERMNKNILVNLPNLIYFTATIEEMEFDLLEEFLLKISSRLQSFSITIDFPNSHYLDSYRWEQLIKEHMTQLNRFRFSFTDIIHEYFEFDHFHSLINGFTSSFWRDHQWIFQILIKQSELTYLIRPYQYLRNDFNTEVNCSSVIQLSVNGTLLGIDN